MTSAGITGATGPVHEFPIDSWRRTIDVNLNGLFYCCREIAPYMLANGYGRIVNVSSVAGKEGNPNASAYSASKAAVLGFTKSLGKELAGTGVLANAITPATFDSPILDQLPASQVEYMRSRIPMGRLGEARESAAMICFMASEDCSFTTAATFDTSGGRTTYWAIEPIRRGDWTLMESEIDPMSLVAPEFRAAAAQIALQDADGPPAIRASIPQIRNSPFFADMQPLPDVDVLQTLAPVGDGHPDVLLYVINARPGAKPGALRPAILHIHGGGQVAGTARSEVPRLQGIARQLDCVIVTVEYRLAPEATYQASIEDNYAGLRWLNEHADEIGVDVERVAVFGESAGGGHAAMLANLATDRGEFPLAFQCLIYPMLDDRTGSTRRVPEYIGRYAWTADWNALCWECFLGMPAGGEDVPAIAVPSRRKNLRNLPPTFIGVGAIDLFVEENVEYAARLISAGVATELIVVPGGFHGFDIFAPETAPAQAFERAKMDALRRRPWESRRSRRG